MLFVILLSIFIAILTVLDNLILATIFFIILVIVCLFQKRIDTKKWILLCVLTFFLSIISVRLRQTIYKFDDSQKQIFGSAKIIDIRDSNSYIIKYNKQSFFLETDKVFQIGDNIFIEGNLSPGYTGNILNFRHQRQNMTHISGYEFSFTKRLITKNIKGTIFPKNTVLQSKGESGIISKIKSNLQSKTINSYGNNRVSGLILGMLIGDKSVLPTSDYESFRDSGLVHIIAVSGGNIVMIVVFLSFILFFLPFYIRIFVILSTIIFYALICGLDSSVLRATIMGGLGLIALLAGRNVDKRRILGMTYVAMLLFNPYYLAYDIGFLFSFSAVIGIILINEKFIINNEESVIDKTDSRIRENDDVVAINPQSATQPAPLQRSTSSTFCPPLGRRCPKDGGFIQKTRKHISIYLIPSLGATIGIFPFMMFFVNKINLISIFANLLILPIIPFVMIYGFISVFLYDLLGRQFITFIEKILINYIFAISDLAGNYGIYLSLEKDWLKYGLVFLFVILLYRKND